jgi:dienelactone hydrolase
MPIRLLFGLVPLLAFMAFSLVTTEAIGRDQPKSDPPTPKKPATPYETAHDKPLDVKEEIVEKAENHTLYRVEFNGIKGDRVPAYLYVPKHAADKLVKPKPAILLQYGSGGNKKTNYIVGIGKQFVARGYVVLTIDSPNVGERNGKDPKGTSIGLASSEQVMHYCGDYSRAMDFLESLAEVDKNRLGYVGVSWGAISGITYVAYDPRVKAMGSMVGGGNFAGLYTAKLAEKIAVDGSRSSDPVCHVARIAPRPLLFINATKDQLILKSWAESLHKYAGAGSKVVWLETDHYFNGVDRAAVCDSVIDFMDEKLVGKRAADKK